MKSSLFQIAERLSKGPQNHRLLIIWGSGLFLLCAGIGFNIAYHKPIWIDEMYNQIVTVAGRSYWQIIWVGSKGGDGNVAPLFYLSQKIITDMAQWIVTPDWLTQEGIYSSLKARIILRIVPVVSVSLSMVLIFYYFCRHYSWLAGVYSFLVSLASFMIWAFWAEARPYPLLLFLTTIQSLVFLKLVEADGPRKARLWRQLCAIHVLLVLTAVLSLIQICSIALLLWLTEERNWKKYIPMFFVPFAIGLYYYSFTPKYEYWFKESPWQLIGASFSKERMLIAVIFIFFIIKRYRQSHKSWMELWSEKFINDAHSKMSVIYFLFLSLMLAGFSLLLINFKLHENFKDGFQFPNRYFIALTPIGIIATTLFSIYLVKLQNSSRGKIIMVLFLAAILFLRLVKTLNIHAI